jgi:H+-translocating NAD(P) transhydrogenase subunit alpha
MIIGVLRESALDERRVAVVPGVVPLLARAKLDVLIERGAGDAAGFSDAEYEAKGARLVDRAEVFRQADVIAQVWTCVAKPQAAAAEDSLLMREGQAVVGMCDALAGREALERVAQVGGRGVMCFALELLPRITRAQAMDVLSSQATVAGYKAVIIAADRLPKMFPMLMTAAGTIAAARVLVIGAGVAGLQAIATAKRLGAVVTGYDIRPAVKEQIESLGAKFLELDLDQREAEGAGGYAKAMDEEFYRKQRELLTKAVAQSDVVITTAAVPGKKAPVLITAEMARGMAPGSVIVDLAAATGGNCELTRPDETVHENGITILGPTNLPATAPYHASQMYARNVAAFVINLAKDGELNINMEDEIIRDTLLTRGGEVIHHRLREPVHS